MSVTREMYHAAACATRDVVLAQTDPVASDAVLVQPKTNAMVRAFMTDQSLTATWHASLNATYATNAAAEAP